MAQPTRYTRRYSATSWAIGHPTVPQPGEALDSEFNAIRQTLDEALDNLALIQRDDGELANQSVGIDQLKTELTLGIQTPTPWVTDTVYAVNNTVTYNNGFYRCDQAHASGAFATDIAAGRWVLMASFVGGLGDVVSVNGQTGPVVLDADDVDDTSTENKFATAAELSKLAGIQSGADVTDTANVAAAGALMDSELADEGAVKALTSTDIESIWESRAVVAMAIVSGGIDTLRTLGYTTAGDGGGALYKRAGSEPSHAGKVQSDDGAWWELAESVVTPAMFGGARDTAGTDSITAIENAYAFAATVKLDGMYYVGSGGVDLTAAGIIFADDPLLGGIGAVTGHTESTGAGLINLKASGITVTRITVDGDDRFRRGVYDDNGGNVVSGNDIKNIYSATASAAGIFCDATVGSVYENNTISEIESVGDATTGNDNGAARAILVSFTSDVSEKFKILNNKISRIIGEEGDGIQIVGFSSPNFYSSAGSIVRGNIITRCSKRALKTQAHDTLLLDNHITMLADQGADVFAGIDVIDAENVRITGNDVHVSGAARGINVSGITSGAAKNPLVKGNRVKTDTSTLHRAIAVNNFEDAVVEGNDVEYGYIALTNGDVVTCANNTGRFVLLSGTIPFIQIAPTITNARVTGNTLWSSANWATVSVQGPNHIVQGNGRMENRNCIYVVGAGAINNIIMGNTSLAPSTAAVTYSGTNSGAQKRDVNNFNMA